MSVLLVTGYERLAHDSALCIDAACDEFESAWRGGERPAIESYLERARGDDRDVLLRELLLLEVSFRRRARDEPRLNDYRARFPSLDEFWLTQALAPATVAGGDSRLINDASSPAPQDVTGFEILGELGRGGMGVVYQARDQRLDRFVALKFLAHDATRDPRRLERFRREARAASALNHPAVCTLHELGDHQGRPFLVLEWVEGHTLRSLIGPHPDFDRLVPLARQVAEALRVAHAAGIVHRDLKPENLMVRPDGYMKVLDFGLARLLSGGSGVRIAEAETDSGVLLGTVQYMSPEQARMESVGSASDVFSFGIVLYELATGRHPFDGGAPLGPFGSTTQSGVIAPHRLNPETPEPLNDLILHMLEPAPHDRPTAAEVEVVLGELAGKGAGVRSVTVAQSNPRPYVGRHQERAALWAGFESVAAGRGAMLCVTGEPGIGKTTVIEAFLAELTGSGANSARGRCTERLGGAEAYLPVLEALGELLRGEAGEAAARALRLLAPSWYTQVVPARNGGPPAALARASSQENRKQEMFAFFQEMTRQRPLALFLDDVHWADVSTVDLLAYLGGRCAGLRLLLLVTYRPTELLVARHPFQTVLLDLQTRGVCREVRLDFLGLEDIDAYLARAFPSHALPADFAAAIYARTEGNPLFVADLLCELRERGVIAEADGKWVLAQAVPDLEKDLPASVRSLIQRKLDRLGEADRRLLAAASVRGYEFDSAVVAETLALEPAEVEERLQVLDQVHGLVQLVREEDLPDRTLTLRYRFVHVLYQNVLFHALSPSRRMSWSLTLAESLQRHYGEKNPAIAAELSCLFSAARAFDRAARQCLLAAQNAARVFAHADAVALAQRGLKLLRAVPETTNRAELELLLQMTVGLQLQITEGFAAAPAHQAYTRARDLCLQVHEGPMLFPVLWGLWLFHKARSELAIAREMANELFALAQDLGDSALTLQAHQALAVTTLCLGEPAATRDHMEQAEALYDPLVHQSHTFQFGQDPGVACRAFGAVALWLLGYPDQAIAVSRDAVYLSHILAQPSSQTLALHFAAMLRQCLGDTREALILADLGTTIATDQGFSFWHAGGTVLRGWATAAAGDANGIDLLRQGLSAWSATGSVTYQPYYLGLLAEVLAGAGRVEEGLAVLDEAQAITRRTAEGLYEAELHRLRGEFLPPGAEAEACFREAIAVARRQGGKSLELRAAMSLYRLKGRAVEVRPLLAESYGWFTEGFDTPDLREAKSLLEAAPV